MTITQTITDPGTAPTRTDPDSFDSRADDFLTALEAWGGVSGEFATYASQANALATTMNGYKTDAESAKDDAETAQAAAEAAEDGAEAAANATVWLVGTTYAAGNRVMDPGDDYALYTSQQGSNTGNTPNSDDGTWWVRTFPTVSDTAYDATSWNGNTDAATKNALRDKFETMLPIARYNTLFISAGAMIPCTTNGAASSTEEYATNDVDLDVMAFDGGATEERVQFTAAMPEQWNNGTVKAKFYWTNASGATAGDTVEWGIKAGALSNDDAIDAALGTAVTISDTLIAAGDLHITAATAAMTIAGTPATGDLIQFEVYRNTDGTDDMVEDAWLTGVLIQYAENNNPAGW